MRHVRRLGKLEAALQERQAELSLRLAGKAWAALQSGDCVKLEAIRAELADTEGGPAFDNLRSWLEAMSEDD